ncbi:TniQ family protein [Rhizobium sp. 11515TR]|uniref:TniQ family protein n=1 Tax=Rhizobium sp. 11515TR TaxID=2028343 RepID=UPI000BA86841|nr:TniQ family protein [Rhizobium sp. 11515TR]ASW08644.1 hypothetical protein CKA34_21885 [Rhizobium sp. 11515TR]
MSGLLRVPFFDDETLLSYLARMGRANGRNSLRGFLNDIGFEPLSIYRGNEAEVARLAELFGVHHGRMLDARIVANSDNTVGFAGGRFNRFGLWRTRFRVCSECLAEDEMNPSRMPGTRRYARAIWMLSSVKTCVKHGRALVALHGSNSMCPDFLRTLDGASEFLSTALAPTSELEPTGFEKFVSERLGGKREHGTILNAASISTAIDMCQLLGMAHRFGRTFRFRKTPENDLRAAYDCGYRALLGETKGVNSVLDAIIATTTKSNKRAGNVLYGRLYRALRKQESSHEYDSIRDMIRQHAIDRMHVLDNSEFFGSVADTEWTSIRTVAVKAGLADETVRTFLSSQNLIQGDASAGEQIFVGAEVARMAVETLSDSIELPEASRTLGWSIFECRRLVTEGIIVPIVSRAKKGVGTRTRYSRAAIIQLKAELIAPGGEQIPDLISLRSALRHFQDSSGKVLRTVFGQKLSRLAYAERGSLLDGLKVDLLELKSVLEPVHGLDANAVCKRLSISRRSLPWLVANGVLRSMSNTGYAITLESIERFERDYVTGIGLANQGTLHPATIGARTRHRNIVPAFPPEDVCSLVFHRTDAPYLLADDQVVVKGRARKGKSSKSRRQRSPR